MRASDLEKLNKLKKKKKEEEEAGSVLWTEIPELIVKEKLFKKMKRIMTVKNCVSLYPT